MPEINQSQNLNPNPNPDELQENLENSQGQQSSEHTASQTLTQPQATPSEIPAWQQLMYEERQARLRAEQELEKLRNTPQDNTPPAPPTFEPGELFENPNKLTNYIQQELQRTTAPLASWVQQQQQQAAYNSLKQRVRLQFPQFAAIESFVDTEMQGRPATEFELQQAVQRAVGYIALNQPQLYLQLIGQPQQPPTPQVPQTPQPQNNQVVPPYVPPTRTPNVPQQNTPKLRDISEYTETERRLMREQGLNTAQWDYLQNTPSEKLDRAHLNELGKLGRK